MSSYLGVVLGPSTLEQILLKRVHVACEDSGAPALRRAEGPHVPHPQGVVGRVREQEISVVAQAHPRDRVRVALQFIQHLVPAQ